MIYIHVIKLRGVTSVIHNLPSNGFLCSSDIISIMSVNTHNFDELWRDGSAREVDSVSLARSGRLALGFLVLKRCNSLTGIDDSLLVAVGNR